MVMDVVVADVPKKFGMLLSRSWATNLKGTLQMDMSYATIPVFGEQRRLYREIRLAYMISSKENLENHPIYAVDTDLGFAGFYNDLCFKEVEQGKIKDQNIEERPTITANRIER